MIGRGLGVLIATTAAVWGVPQAAAQDALGRGNALDGNLYGNAAPRSGRVDTSAPLSRPGGSARGSVYSGYSNQFTSVNPMGDGRALDRNLSLTSRFNGSSRVDPLQEMRFRSAVVTGNAAGGLSFRGDLGYGAARSFRGDLGSNDLFAFRRDSLYSGLVGAGIRGTDALQYQMSLTTGSQLPPTLVGDLVVQESFTTRAPDSSATPNEALLVDGEVASAIGRRPAGDDDDGSMHSMLRATSAYTTSMSLQPVLLNRWGQTDTNPDIGVTASTLRGIKLSALPEADQSPAAQQRIDDSARDAQGVEGAGRIETGYDAVLRQFEEAEAARLAEEAERQVDPQETRAALSIADRFQELREQVSGANQGQPRGGESGTDSGGDDPLDPTGGDDLDRLQELGVYDEETVRLLRSAREPVTRLVDPDEAAQRNPYVEHMEVGQRLLAQERFFDAEERFTRAIGVRAGDVMAQVGRIHAQVGAGMYLSAALNMRVLLVQHPEVVGVKYDERLLPGETRRKAVFTRLREKIGIGADGEAIEVTDQQLRRESGLLLAYMGYQFGDAVAIDQGLDAFESVTAMHAGEPSHDIDRRIHELLRRVWEGQDEVAP